MSKIKGVILSVEDILVPQGKVDTAIFSEVEKLISYFKRKVSNLLFSQTELGL